MDYDYEDEYAVEQRKQKQMYLKTEIIDRGYDGAQFAEFLNTQKETGGANIDVWSFNELKALVKEFKKLVDDHYGGPNQSYEVLDQPNYAPHENQHNQPASAEHPDPTTPTTPTSISTQTREDIANSESIKEENYSQILTVKMSERSPLNEENNVTIIVGEPELVKGGLFSASYIQYKVTTQPFNWSVKRRFSDFFWLRSILQKMHLGYVIPPVPKKKNKGKFENDFIRKRMYFLENFLNSCVSNEEFKSNKFLYFFLSIADENQMKAKRKESEKILKVNKLDEVSTLSGQIPLEVNPNLKYYAANVGELCNQTDPIYKKIRKLSKQLITDLDQVSNTIFSIGECYAALYAASTNFNKNINIGKNPHLDDTYLTLNNMMVSWGEQVLGQIKIVQKNMVYFYKYAHYENESFREVVQERAKKGLEYITRKRELMAKKEKLFAQGDINRWELSSAALKEYSREQLIKDKNLAFSLMCSKETATVRELRDTFAYQNAMTYTEMEHGFIEKCKEYSFNFHEFAKSQSDNLTEVHVHWADLMAHFSETKLTMKTGQIMDRNTIVKPQDQDFGGNIDDE